MNWLIPGELAKSSIPRSSDLIMLQEEHIDSIVNLLEEWYQEVVGEEMKSGFNVLHSPVPDFGAPSLDQLKTIVTWIDNEIALGKKVLVHCYAGIGRTGTVLIAYLMKKGYDRNSAAAEASRIGAAAQSVEQEKILEDYYQHLQSTGG